MNLRGYDGGEPLRAETALRMFLRALGVDGSLPHLDQLIAVYCNATAGRRLLMVADNASTVDHGPLLPGGTDCSVIVTSRDDLPRLVARDGARRLTLSGLGDRETIELMEALPGPTEPEPLVTLSRLCGGLPPALRITAERITVQFGATPASLVAELREANASWTCSVSMETPSPILRRLAPGDPTGCGPPDRADGSRQVRAARPATGLRRRTGHGPARRRTRHGRVLLPDFYRRNAAAAMDLLVPYDRPGRPLIDPGGRLHPATATAARAQGWLDHERADIAPAVGFAATSRWPGHAPEQARTGHQEALRIATEVREPFQQAKALEGIAEAARPAVERHRARR